MKILAFSDTHLNKKSIKEIIKKSKKADFLICAGDISWFGTGLKKVLNELNKKIKKDIYIISGNHEEGEPLGKICKSLKYVHFCDKKIKKINGYTFFFWGGGGFAQKEKALEEATKKFKKSLKKEDEVVFVTHGPPYKCKLDFLPWAGHVGCKSSLKFIKSIKPILHISGHLHEHLYENDTIGETVVINAGPEGTMVEL